MLTQFETPITLPNSAGGNPLWWKIFCDARCFDVFTMRKKNRARIGLFVESNKSTRRLLLIKVPLAERRAQPPSPTRGHLHQSASYSVSCLRRGCGVTTPDASVSMLKGAAAKTARAAD